MLVRVETIEKMFDGRRNNRSIDYEGLCRSCSPKQEDSNEILSLLETTVWFVSGKFV